MKKKVILTILSLIILLISLGYVLANFFVPPYIIKVEKQESIRYNDQVIINVSVGTYKWKMNKDLWCILVEDDTKPSKTDSGWVKASNDYCSFTVPEGDYTAYVKDSYGNIGDINSAIVKINKVLDIKTNKDILYMYIGREETISYDLVKLGNIDENVNFKSDNENIAKVDENGKVTGVNIGETFITLSIGDTKKNVEVVVSSFITRPVINTSKPYISCGQFNKEDNDLLDAILADRVRDAGEGTRAGVVEAARFLALEFAFRVHYFYENGRLQNHGDELHVDGEGRYYHKGLYLDKSRYSLLESRFVGPATWGCDLQNYTNWGPWVRGGMYPNGFDCSGFVTWALLNGGVDIGDIGAGPSDWHDLDEAGEKVYITDELMASGRVKVGDLIGLPGHAAILAGWDDENYYIAESLNTTKGVVMTVVNKSKLVHNSIYTYIILMDNVYSGDGNLTNMW